MQDQIAAHKTGLTGDICVLLVLSALMTSVNDVTVQAKQN